MPVREPGQGGHGHTGSGATSVTGSTQPRARSWSDVSALNRLASTRMSGAPMPDVTGRRYVGVPGRVARATMFAFDSTDLYTPEDRDAKEACDHVSAIMLVRSC